MQYRLLTEIYRGHGQLYMPDIVLMLPTVKLTHVPTVNMKNKDTAVLFCVSQPPHSDFVLKA
jgi:hypothetical protein